MSGSPPFNAEDSETMDLAAMGRSFSGLADEIVQVPSAARMYDYYLGGHHNLAKDRGAADRAIEIYPGLPLVMRVNRAFLRRAVRFLCSQGIDRFLDIGSGIPTVGNVHQIAEQASPGARVVYVDVDPVAVAHSAALLEGNPRASIVKADLREPEAILTHPDVERLLAAGRPIALMLAFVLHFIFDDEQVLQILAKLRAALPSGSFVVISHGTTDAMPRDVMGKLIRLYSGTSQPIKLRTHAEVLRFFDGLELLEPGLVFVSMWRPEDERDLLFDKPELSVGFAGIGGKP